jgi:membrane fusion protein, multidrug efflux system
MIRTLAVVVALGLTGLTAACSGKPEGGAQAAKPGKSGGKGGNKYPVEVQPVAKQKVEYAVTAVGSLEAFETVQVTARVAGVAERVLFAEGANVEAGQVLAEIEPRRYQIARQSAAAAHERAKAAEAEAKAQLARREEAVRGSPGLITAEEIETFRTRVQTAAADVASARAALEKASLDLRDAYVRASFAGLIESRPVQTGQYLQPGTVIATVVRRDPLMLRFPVAETDAGSITPGMNVRFRIRQAEEALMAKVTHVGQEADPKSRMVKVSAEVAPDLRAGLRPGTFAEVTVPIGGAIEVPVIPQTAIRPSEKGFLAYVIEKDVARERVVQLGMRTADGRVEVKSGVKEGEALVVRGSEALREGAAVRVVGPEKTADATPKSGG